MSEGQCISHTPPTCASAASAWGSQKVISMARYSAMAADSSARACSRRSISGIQRAEAEVAVGLQRAHAEVVGQGEGLAVVGFSRLDIRGVAMDGDAAKQSPGIRLVALLLLGLGDVACPGRVLHGVLQATRQQCGFAPPPDPERIARQKPVGRSPFQGLGKQRQGFSHPAGKGIRMGEKC